MDIEPSGELVEVLSDLLELLTVPADQVHLVDREHDVPDAQQRRQERVPARLFEQAVPGVDQNNRQLCGGRPGDHVARVLNLTGSVADAESPLGRGGVPGPGLYTATLLPSGASAAGDPPEASVL